MQLNSPIVTTSTFTLLVLDVGLTTWLWDWTPPLCAALWNITNTHYFKQSPLTRNFTSNKPSEVFKTAQNDDQRTLILEYEIRSLFDESQINLYFPLNSDSMKFVFM